MKPRVLLVDDAERYRRALVQAMSSEYEIRGVSTTAQARGEVSRGVEAVLLDLRLNESVPSHEDALELLRQLRRDFSQVPVIIVTAHGDIETAVECMRLGAADFIEKSADLREVKARIQKALEHARVARRLAEVENELAIVEPRQLVGKSHEVREVKALISAAARDGRVTVLLTGESGTGKELVARAIHASGKRASEPFVAVAPAGLPAATLESELFGYEQGAFTDARRRKIGFIERARRGVLFLDEIGELPADLQVKLLRFLEERAFYRLGGQEEIPVDVQVVAATNARLDQALRRGAIREDFYYRLKVFEIALPPLREHRDDIAGLADHFLERLAGPARPVTGISEGSLRKLREYSWPGNVRELKNAIERAILKATLASRRTIELEDLPKDIQEYDSRGPATRLAELRPEGATIGETRALELARIDLRDVVEALSKTGGRKGEAWRLLGLNDRWALRRLVVRHFRSHPKLEAEFPGLYRQFSPRRPARGSAEP